MAALANSPVPAPIRVANFRHDLDFSVEQLNAVLDLSKEVKQSRTRFSSALKGRYAALLFEKPSLRTRMTFELAMKQLGGDVVTQIGMIGDREPLKDVARNLARWTDVIVARTFAQETVDQLAHWSGLPVINALTDLYHPCQALADILTLKEKFGRLRGLKLAYVGDGNNVAHSLMLCCARLGINMTIATPAGYAPKTSVIAHAIELSRISGSRIEVTTDPLDAVQNSHAVYTDVWTSMGQEAEAEERKRIFSSLPGESEPPLLRPSRYSLYALPARQARSGSHR